jgi:hypothetical protein
VSEGVCTSFSAMRVTQMVTHARERSLSLSLTHTHTHTHTRARARVRALLHDGSQKNTRGFN